MHSLTLYFLGAARPLYLEAGDYDHAAAKLFRAIRDLDADKRAQIEAWARHIDSERGRHPAYAGISCEYGALGLSWRFGPQDVPFARRMRSLGAFPGLDYSDAVDSGPAVIERDKRARLALGADAVALSQAGDFTQAAECRERMGADAACEIPGCNGAGPGGICDSCLPGAVAPASAAQLLSEASEAESVGDIEGAAELRRMAKESH
jgi:hypothetical protein